MHPIDAYSIRPMRRSELGPALRWAAQEAGTPACTCGLLYAADPGSFLLRLLGRGEPMACISVVRYGGLRLFWAYLYIGTAPTPGPQPLEL